MSKRNKYLILAGVGILLVVLLFFLPKKNSDGKESSDDPKSEVNEGNKSDSSVIKKPVNPAGTYLLYNLLKKYSKTKSIRTLQTTHDRDLSALLPMTNENGYPNLYVSISESFFPKKKDLNYLEKFVSAGNYAMISSEDFSANFSKEIFGKNYLINYYFYDTSIYVHFNHPEFSSQDDLTLYSEELNFHGHPKYRHYGYFYDEYIDDETIKISGFDDHTNCVMIPYGDGFFIIHTQPYNFSNINVARKDGKTNAENIYSHYPYNNIYWHQNFGKYSEYRGIPKPKVKKQLPQIPKSSPLEYILENPMLFMAFILTLIGLAIYMLVFSKRQQRIIPPIEANSNTSLEFLDIISKLYYSQKQHNKLVNHMLNIFVTFVREHYYINLTTKQPDLMLRLSEKSGIEEAKIKSIIEKFRSAKSKQFSEQELIDLYVELEYFYQHCN